jgi:hypothetical protein
MVEGALRRLLKEKLMKLFWNAVAIFGPADRRGRSVKAKRAHRPTEEKRAA